MNTFRRTLIAFALSASALALPGLALQHAAAQPSSQSLRLVVPYAAGGSGDMIARTLGERVATTLGPVVVDNKPGGGTVIGSQSVAAAPADGQHVLLVAASFVINPHLIRKLPFDVAKDFAPVTLLASNPHVLVVSNAVPANDLQGFIAWARSRKGAATFASFGNGSSGHLGFELFKKAGNFDMVHVPYKGVAPAMTDLMGGQVDAMLTDLPQAVESIKAGKMKAIAIAADARAASLPEVATFAQAGLPGFESRSWYGLVVRSGTSPARIAALNSAFVAALGDPAIRQKFAAAGLDVIGSSAADFSAHMQRESAKYAQAIKSAGLQAE
ncbi:MAG: tripartite tricarboxylate transporter substrate binding protein [Burkholderiales bacterium]|nr:tripartite tricarboxylate transporter substrate binding protein [Burkholderiales bacterium]